MLCLTDDLIENRTQKISNGMMSAPKNENETNGKRLWHFFGLIQNKTKCNENIK